ncbi:MAG: zinc-ribbon domain-containing protein [Proteobacteria bacterium]|nr:zinc-ribbon domain-containing protein [Pseudomonadota bacterium]
MYTQCPLCDTQYRISAAELKAALGKVRCAHCQSVFNALSHLTDTPPEIPHPHGKCYRACG